MDIVAAVTPVTLFMCLYQSQTRMFPEVIPPWMDATHPRVEDLRPTERYSTETGHLILSTPTCITNYISKSWINVQCAVLLVFFSMAFRNIVMFYQLRLALV